MATIKILHGSDHIIKKPDLINAKKTNDYGKGFYCTEDVELSKEWATKNNTDGFSNEYSLDTDGLKVLNLLDGKHTVLNWIALLLKYRTFTINNDIALNSKEYIINNFSIDTSDYDLIIGYRADDSYFSYAQSFINNTLPLKSLARALKLGELGIQVVLVSDKALNQLTFLSATPVEKEIYYPKYKERDFKARESFRSDIKKSKSYLNDIFVMDIIREEIKNNDPRIQRIVLK